MVGTYHRAGVSRWVPILKPLVKLVGYRMQVRVAVSEAARETAQRSSKGDYEVLYNGVDMERFAEAEPAPTDRPTVLFLGRHETRKGLSVLLDAFAQVDRPAVLWVAGDGPQGEVQRRRHPESDRVKWLGMLSDEESGRPAARGGRAVRAVAARRVVRHGRAGGDGGRVLGRRLGPAGVPLGRRRARRPGIRRATSPRWHGRWAWRWPTPPRAVGSPRRTR